MKPLFRHYAFLLLGVLVLAANRIRHSITGYRTPTPFSAADASNVSKAIEHDQKIAQDYVMHLRALTGLDEPLSGKHILELGPGGDLGVGITLLGFGAESYTAFDAHDLAGRASPAIYDELLGAIAATAGESRAVSLRRQLEALRNGESSKLDYVVHSRFDFSALGARRFDLIVSCAAFEHFDNVQETLSQVSRVAKKDAIFVAIVDLQTHTRILRETDALNIYRIPDAVYRLVKFRGIPNRVQISEYERELRANGWEEIVTWPLTTVSEHYWRDTAPYLPRRFQNTDTKCLSVAICATRGDVRVGSSPMLN